MYEMKCFEMLNQMML